VFDRKLLDNYLRRKLHMNDKKDLGNLVQHIRMANRMSQATLAELLLVTPMSIKRSETGTSSEKTILDILDAILYRQDQLGLDPDVITQLQTILKSREDAIKLALTKSGPGKILSSVDFLFIRKRILDLNQINMAMCMGTTQCTISHWESKSARGIKPHQAAKCIRIAADYLAEKNGVSREDAERDLFDKLERNRLL